VGRQATRYLYMEKKAIGDSAEGRVEESNVGSGGSKVGAGGAPRKRLGRVVAQK